MALSVRIELSGEDRQKCSFTMPAKANNLNRHGAAIQLNRELLLALLWSCEIRVALKFLLGSSHSWLAFREFPVTQSSLPNRTMTIG